MHVQEFGAGKPVILLHGFPLSGQIWSQVAQILAGRYRVIVPDLPGHGATPVLRGPDGATMELMAGEVLHLLGRLNLEQAAVAGHSMGGYTALALARIAPHRLAGLGLVATQARDDTPEARQGRHALAEKVAREGSAAAAAGMAPKLFGEAVTQGSPLYQETEALMRSTSAEGVQAALLGLAARADARAWLDSIAVPTVVVAGQQDRIVPGDRAEEMAAAIAGSSLTVIEGAGHMPMLERPSETADALRTWLARVYA